MIKKNTSSNLLYHIVLQNETVGFIIILIAIVVSQKAAIGKANSETVTYGMMLLFGLPIVIPLWLWLSVGGIGIFLIFQRYSLEILCVSAMFIVQIAVVFYMQPVMSEVPYVWFRYIAHFHPFIAITVASCIATLIYLILHFSIFKKIVGIIFVAGCCISFFIYHLVHHNYNVHSYDSHNIHPMIQFLPDAIDSSELQQAVSPFYQKLLKTLPQGNLVETPMVVIFPLYKIYEYWHNRKIYTCTLGENFAQQLFNSTSGTNFNTIVNLNNFEVLNANNVRYLIIHKRVKEEIALVFNILKQNPIMNTQIANTSWLFTDMNLNAWFGTHELVFSPTIHPIYDDKFISVYDIGELISHRTQNSYGLQ